MAYQFQFRLVDSEIRFRFNDPLNEGSETELKEGVNGHCPGIDSGYSGGSEHDTFLFSIAHHLPKERGLACPRLASEKQTHIRFLHNESGYIQFKISSFRHISLLHTPSVLSKVNVFMLICI